MNGRTIRNIAGFALMALGLFGAYFSLALMSGPGLVALNGGVLPLMILQADGLIISATVFLSGLIVLCTGGPHQK